jgi:vacuolar-type H+-ATPase subunit C/Vma6
LQYFSDALKAVRGRDGGPRLRRYLRMEIDHRNVINEFRAIRMGMTVEKRQSMVIPGGKIDSGTMRQTCQAESDEELIEILRRSSSFDDSGFDEAMEESERMGSLDPYAELLSHQRHTVLKRFAYLSPISPFPIIYYIERKALEVRNLRLLVRGKAVGLPNEVLEAHMDY